jgi:hypothetical protein
MELLLRLCWAPKPRNRPGFQHIIVHLDVAEREIMSTSFDANANPGSDLLSPMSSSQMDEVNANPTAAVMEAKANYEQRLKETTDLFFKLSTFLKRLERHEKYRDSVCLVRSGRRYSL